MNKYERTIDLRVLAVLLVGVYVFASAVMWLVCN